MGWIRVGGGKQKCRGVLDFCSENGATVIDNVGIDGGCPKKQKYRTGWDPDLTCI